MTNTTVPFFHRRNVVPFVFLAPFLILFLTFRVWAVIQAMLLSFEKVQGVGSSEWIGLGNYQFLFNDPTFYKALLNTAYYTGGTLVLLIVIPLVLAALLYSGLVKRAGVFRTTLFLPVLTSLVVVGVVFRLILSPEGLLNSWLGLAGIPPIRWLETADLAIPAMLIIATWRWTGLNMVYFSSGLANISPDLYDAAAIDGANGWQRFFYITVPQLRPITLFVMTLTLIGGFQLFVEPSVLWSGGASPGQGGLSIVVFLYRTAFTSFNLGYASTIGVVLALIIMILSLAQLRLFGFFKKEE
ncbi:MAG: sugar ABC transporter permease [Chloroflexi bacterium]|nr:sugar ABC transporter permease [Chloroflexota bacterium]